MDLSPKGIIDHLRLRRPIYSRTAAYGHFGRDPEYDGGFSWEKLDLIDEIKSNSRLINGISFLNFSLCMVELKAED